VNRAQDTIAAIATAPGRAGIAIVRVSGPASLAIADRVFRCRGEPPSRRPANTFVYGHIVADGDSGLPRRLDEAILLVYRAPHSYTREDVIEIHGHGGTVCAQLALRAVLDAGAKMAEPGEFTRRAFLNGRIDLVQAEAVADMIAAQSARSAAASIEQLRGSISHDITVIYDSCMDVVCSIEAALDFPEEDIPDPDHDGALDALSSASARLGRLLATWHDGRLLREGAKVVICGEPNAGKSTLFNALIGDDRAIVAPTPGTTRDTLEEQILVDGVAVRLIDTAGLRDTDCAIEREGVLRAREMRGSADLELYVVDGSRPVGGSAPRAGDGMDRLDPQRCILVVNKCDLGLACRPEEFRPLQAVVSSLIHGKGVEEVRTAMAVRLGLRTDVPPHAVISERHRAGIVSAVEGLDQAIAILSTGRSDAAVLACSALRSTIESLGRLVGRSFDSDLLDSIFKRFCVGK
jgi:tRNA modification GTPase